MNIIILIAGVILSANAIAGSGHSHSHGHGHGHGHSHGKKVGLVTSKQAQTLAKTHILRLVKIGKIDSTWNSSKFEKAKKKTFAGRKEWVVTFENDQGKKGKRLFIFLKLNGDFLAANFTGK